METEITNEYIEKALIELVPVLGTKESVDQKKIISLIGSKKIKEALKEIASYLDLPIDVNVSYVPKGYRPNVNDGFQQTMHLVQTDWRGRGTSGITAQVSIPSNLPLFGTPALNGFPINVRLSEDCAESPATFIAVMAHELSHILLYSLLHEEKNNEFCTDLTAMLLGFGRIMRKGRKVVKQTSSTRFGFFSSTTTTHTETTTYGYLSDGNFEYAFKKIDEVLKKQKAEKKQLVGKLKQFKKRLTKAKAIAFYFQKYLDYLDNNRGRTMSEEDGRKISAFHQAGYIDSFRSLVAKNERKWEVVFNFVQNLSHYTARNTDRVRQYETELKSVYEELAKEHALRHHDVKILGKHVGFLFKLKLRLAR
jgi:hypothetical protein